MDDLFNEANVPESNWFKFEKVGDRIKGELVELRDNVPARDPSFPNQRIFVLKQENGEIMNVGISMDKDYIIGRTNRVKPGDKIGFEFKKEVPSVKGKGFRPAKSIEVYIVAAPAEAATETPSAQ